MQKENKGFALILIVGVILIVSVLTAGGVLVYQQTKGNNQKSIGGDKDEHGCLTPAGYSWCEIKNKCLRTWEEKCEKTTAVKDQTAGWKTYTSNELKYSFKYPANWKVIPNSAYSTAGYGGIVGYTITASNSKTPPDNERIDIGGAQVDCASLSNLNRQEHPAGVLCKTNYPVYTYSVDPNVISVFNIIVDSISDIKTTK